MKRSANPNYIYVLGFSIPFIIYSFQWSTIYPDLSAALLCFYAATFVICLALGYITNKIIPFQYNKIPVGKYNLIIVIVIYFLYTIEVLYSRQIPFLGILSGSFDYSEYDFGIPVLHTFLVSFNMFYCVYVYHQFLSSKNKTLLWQYFLLLLPFVLLFSRSGILGVLLSTFFVFLFHKQTISKATIFKSICIVLVVLWGFGYLGNLRSAGGDPLSIPLSSGGTDEFIQSDIPKEYYWTYLYVASPVANLQNNINYTHYPEADWKTLFLSECLPEFFTKFVSSIQENKSFYQINEYLNVGTIFVYSFSYERWAGIIFMFLYFILIINIYYLIVHKSKRFSTTGLALLCNVIIFATFHNTIAYSTASMQLFFPVLFSIFKRQGLSV